MRRRRRMRILYEQWRMRMRNRHPTEEERNSINSFE
jgi:hypothetical protein